MSQLHFKYILNNFLIKILGSSLMDVSDPTSEMCILGNQLYLNPIGCSSPSKLYYTFRFSNAIYSSY